MLVVAQDTREADRLQEKLTSATFLGGRYKGRVITVHSNQTGEEKDETVQQLLSVEDPDNQTEIVIHVNMLKEGWDVTNLYTIVPLRAANSKTLVEQSVGRGLRLPYGKRTGVFAVDRLNIVSHDRFDEIVAAANDPNSIIRAKVIIGRDIPDKAQKTVEVQSKLEAAIASLLPSGPTAQPLFASEQERTAARAVLRALENAPRALRGADLRRPEVQEELIQRLRLDIGSAQTVLPDGTAATLDLKSVVSKTADLITTLSIDIPRITVVPKGDVTARYLDFDLDTRTWPRYATVAKDIVIQHLTDHERYKLISGDGVVREKRLEDYLVFGLIDYDEISYDDTSELLYKLAGQAVAHLQSYLSDQAEVENVVQYHRKALVQMIHAQMEEHFEQTATEYEPHVSPGFQTIQPRLVAIDADSDAHDFRVAVDDKSEITGLLFGGFRKCLQTSCKYRSDPERVFSVILEDDPDVLKWFRPTRQDIKIYYKTGTIDREYEPDFIVESKTGKWICETKRASEMNDSEVRPALQAANHHEIGHVGTNDEQNKSRGHHQNLKPVLIVLAHAGNTGASGAEIESLLPEFCAIVRAHLTPVRAQPLLEFHPHFCLNETQVGSRPDAANQVQPMRIVFVHIRIRGVGQRLGIQRQKQIGRIIAQPVAEEIGRRDSHNCERFFVYIEDAADYGWIGSVPLPPQAITHNGGGRSVGLVVLSGKHPSGICPDAKHGEIIAGDEFSGRALGRLRTVGAANSELRFRRLEGGQLGEAFGVVSEVLVQTVRNHGPFLVLAIAAVITAS
jgi:hypothetical protein